MNNGSSGEVGETGALCLRIPYSLGSLEECEQCHDLFMTACLQGHTCIKGIIWDVYKLETFANCKIKYLSIKNALWYSAKFMLLFHVKTRHYITCYLAGCMLIQVSQL